MDTPHGQAIITYYSGMVNRPAGALVRLVKKNEQIPSKGLCFDPQVQTDRQLQTDLQEEDQEIGHGADAPRDDDNDHQDGADDHQGDGGVKEPEQEEKVHLQDG